MTADANTWPKACACGARYDRAAWELLELAGPSEDGDGGWLEQRHCACRSTLAVQLEPRPLADAVGLYVAFQRRASELAQARADFLAARTALEAAEGAHATAHAACYAAGRLLPRALAPRYRALIEALRKAREVRATIALLEDARRKGAPR